MKILFSSYHNPHFFTVTEYIENAINLSGNTLFRFDDRQHFIPGRIRYKIKWLNKLDYNHINSKLVKIALDEKPEMVLVAGGQRIFGKTVEKLKKNNIICVLWTTDAPLVFEPILNAAPYYDYIFCQGTEALEILEKSGLRNVYWLPVGCDPLYHKKVQLTESEKKFFGKDACFVGSFYPNRWNVLKELSDFEIGVWGPGWRKIVNHNKSKMEIFETHLNYATWVKIFNACKIVIVIHYQDGEIPCYQISPKVFEALACGSFVLVDRQKDVFSLFDDKHHLAGFDDVNDLRKKIKYYLNNPEQRKRIANAGFREVLTKHSYIHRLDTMLKIIES